ncbi:MAG TPA: hypothetical protein VF007_08860 [Stellaceae bacterium]
MTPGASIDMNRPGGRRTERGILWASIVAVLFAAVAALSFALDQTVTLSSLPTLQPAQTAGQ